jgi:hypothetical protein
MCYTLNNERSVIALQSKAAETISESSRFGVFFAKVEQTRTELNALRLVFARLGRPGRCKLTGPAATETG